MDPSKLPLLPATLGPPHRPHGTLPTSANPVQIRKTEKAKLVSAAVLL